MSEQEEIIIWEQGFIKGFQFIPYNKPLSANIAGLYEGKQVERCTRLKREKASRNTHNYYRGVVLPVAAQSEMFRGWDLVEIHKYFTSKFLKDVVHKTIGTNEVIIVTTMSTSSCSQKRMNEFIEAVKNELTFCGIEVPELEK